jgi:hypothetical protein
MTIVMDKLKVINMTAKVRAVFILGGSTNGSCNQTVTNRKKPETNDPHLHGPME